MEFSQDTEKMNNETLEQSSSLEFDIVSEKGEMRLGKHIGVSAMAFQEIQVNNKENI